MCLDGQLSKIVGVHLRPPTSALVKIILRTEPTLTTNTPNLDPTVTPNTTNCSDGRWGHWGVFEYSSFDGLVGLQCETVFMRCETAVHSIAQLSVFIRH